jgi:hypothetical protein
MIDFSVFFLKVNGGINQIVLRLWQIQMSQSIVEITVKARGYLYPIT